MWRTEHGTCHTENFREKKKNSHEMQVVGFNLMRWELFKVTEFIKPMV